MIPPFYSACCTVVRSFLHYVSERLQNKTILWAMERLVTGEMTHAIVELRNKCSQAHITIVIIHEIIQLMSQTSPYVFGSAVCMHCSNPLHLLIQCSLPIYEQLFGFAFAEFLPTLSTSCGPTTLLSFKRNSYN